jgi:hypothetical protein
MIRTFITSRLSLRPSRRDDEQPGGPGQIIINNLAGLTLGRTYQVDVPIES